MDVGGTFTDLFVWRSDGAVSTFKALSTPHDPSEALLDGLSLAAQAEGLPAVEFLARIGTIVHGTTVTTNAVLTRRGAATALLTTDGFRDALEMRRGIREAQYDNRYRNVVPLVPRFLRLPIRGRVNWAGEETSPLDEAGVRSAARAMRAAGVSAVAICFLNAFANPSHEQRAAAILREEMPDAFLSVSTDVLPVIRFYNRVSTTALDAYVGPVLRAYLDSLVRRLAGAGFVGTLLIMQSSGGVALPVATLGRPAGTLLSGPAAGPSAGLAVVANGTRASDAIVVDMGGTSFDASLARAGEVALKSEGEIERLRIALPMLDIVTIGAGGGSIGWLDAGKMLRMGPASAGADPGPACYGRGGKRPTCTDAQVVLGYLDPEYFAGGRMKLDASRAREAIRREIADPLGLSVEDAAAGMIRVINANMAHGVRRITVKRGLDPRGFPLVVAGGAGGAHGCEIARELGIPRVVVPAIASTLCAAGMLLSDLGHDFARSLVAPFEAVDLSKVADLARAMADEGESMLANEGVAPKRREHQVSLDLRYRKQYHEVTVRLPPRALEPGDRDAIGNAFHAEHERLYGYDLRAEGTPLELITIRVRSVGRTDKPALPRLPRGGVEAKTARKGHRRAYVPERNAFTRVPVYDGARLRAGNRLAGPALIERPDTTIFVSASYRAVVDDRGSCVLTGSDR